MPIDYKKYPKNWKTEIRPAVMARAESKCEKCGIENYSVGWRQGKDGQFIHALKFVYGEADGPIISKTYKEAKAIADNRNRIARKVRDQLCMSKYIVIVLTVAHLNHDINDNRIENLMALCQRCHNVMDAPYRAKNRAKNKK